MVGVMGSGARAHEELALPLGRGLARLGVHLLTGGGGGVMASVSKAFAQVGSRVGLVIGVVPASGGLGGGEPPPGYPNPWVEILVRTHLAAKGVQGASPASRNHVNVLSSDVVVALPGGAGTASEVELAVRYGRPLILFGEPDRALSLPGEVAATCRVAEVEAFIRRLLGPPGGRHPGMRGADTGSKASDRPETQEPRR